MNAVIMISFHVGAKLSLLPRLYPHALMKKVYFRECTLGTTLQVSSS